MSKKKINKKYKKVIPEENENLPGFDIRINPLGEVQSTYDIDEVNAFLNENLTDKKLKNKIKRSKDEADNPKSDQ
jgi:hypothetical protein